MSSDTTYVMFGGKEIPTMSSEEFEDLRYAQLDDMPSASVLVGEPITFTVSETRQKITSSSTVYNVVRTEDGLVFKFPSEWKQFIPQIREGMSIKFIPDIDSDGNSREMSLEQRVQKV